MHSLALAFAAAAGSAPGQEVAGVMHRLTGSELILYAFVFLLAIFLGIELIEKIPPTLHTPLMSATNAVHGIVIVGTLLVAGAATPTLGPVAGPILGFIAVVLGTLNVVGGYVVTDRMLEMFKSKKAGR